MKILNPDEYLEGIGNCGLPMEQVAALRVLHKTSIAIRSEEYADMTAGEVGQALANTTVNLALQWILEARQAKIQ